MELKHAIIFRQAFVNMGYRHMDEKESIWGKPVGFGIIIAEVKDETIEFKTMFNNVMSEVNIWGSSIIDIKEVTDGVDGEELYKKCVYNIAYKEFEAHADKMFFPMSGSSSKTFDFRNVL